MDSESPDGERLHQLILSEHPAVSIQTFEEDEALQLVIDTALEYKIELWAWSISRATPR